jgi:formylglycine-generating enzyme required for sulfatase activity
MRIGSPKETGKEPGKAYRLPSETEWEYAARAGTEGHYWWCEEDRPNCDIPPDMANCLECNGTKGVEGVGGRTLPVGSFSANRFHLYDTAGNVYEWVQDCWHKSYKGAPDDGFAWEKDHGGDCRRLVVRGGSWNIEPVNLRSADRYWNYADPRNFHIGFRLAQDL